MENICRDIMPHGPHFIQSEQHDVTTNIFAYGTALSVNKSIIRDEDECSVPKCRKQSCAVP